MKKTERTGEDQEPKPKTDETPTGNGAAKRKTKLVIHSGMIAFHPPEVEKASEPTAEEKSIPLPVTGDESNPKETSKPDTKEVPPESLFSAITTPTHAPRSIDQSSPLQSRNQSPAQRFRDIDEAAKNVPPAKLPWHYRLRPTAERTHRAYWDVAATFSLIINALLVAVVIILAGQIRNLKTTVNNLLGGLYGNFVKMDQAAINTTITVNTQIPLDFTLPVTQNTDVTLTRDVNIQRAHVVINTGIFNINTQASVTLPVGTILPIALDLKIPVQSTIPISLQVPVSIPLNQTGLHEPFNGLQASLRPLTCLFNQNAQYPDGFYICSDHGTPTPGTP